MDASNFMDLTAKWLLLIGYFFLLIQLFSNRITVEGLPGYLEVIFVIAPLNLIVGGYIASHFAVEAGLPIVQLLFASFLLNAVLLFVFIKILPGMLTTTPAALVIFCALFSLSSLLLLHVLVPPVASWG
ncbi:TPA: hypothetical protein DDW35_09415 [Candidatus Sumerlaeota bacterium]|jgi:hypothetical protein|nr:hypothetical protein [Candidatus Sumerlaeota bacterium]